ncbi:MAG: hypothetical protein WAN65_05605 [Candidatus Sulfotelmatobacter sp.]
MRVKPGSVRTLPSCLLAQIPNHPKPVLQPFNPRIYMLSIKRIRYYTVNLSSDYVDLNLGM